MQIFRVPTTTENSGKHKKSIFIKSTQDKIETIIKSQELTIFSLNDRPFMTIETIKYFLITIFN